MRLIDADALINTLQELFDKREKEARFTGDRGVMVTWNDAIYHIKTAPTIEERKTGKWEKQRETYCSWSCSVCKEIVVAMPERMGYPLYDFCPNCGARMVVKHE